MKRLKLIVIMVLMGSGISARAESRSVIARVRGVSCHTTTGIASVEYVTVEKNKVKSYKMNVWNEYLCDATYSHTSQKIMDIGFEAIFKGHNTAILTISSKNVVTDIELVEKASNDAVVQFEKNMQKNSVLKQLISGDFPMIDMRLVKEIIDAAPDMDEVRANQAAAIELVKSAARVD